ncbi:MAG: TolC family protein [Candidatus Eremiobacteraeota bacterium]|nr:TolC family protein [Candidatus Eremiobacteraeota bacterium]MBC5804010.1 TolC family protein [Candidatus Eremiobacteraeota bacterium]MBC5820700.1 TolC family protein [Candidatus Eremiobacteraeota bacterium]
MRKAALALAGALVWPMPVSAQPTPVMLTLQQAVARVQARGFDVRMAQDDATAAAADAALARSSLRPQLSVSGNLLDANEPQLGMPIARQAYGAASISIPLSTPSNALRAREANDTSRAAQTSALGTANDAVFAAVLAYRNVQLEESVLAARHAAVADEQTHLRFTEERVTAGKAARYLILRDRAALAAAQQAEEDAAAAHDQAAYGLEAMLDLNQGPIALEPLQQATYNDSRGAVLARALRQRPSIIEAQQRVAAARAGIAAAQTAYRPSAILTAQSYNGSSSPYLGGGGGQVQITASLPIADGGSRAAALAEARAHYDRAIAARDQARAVTIRDAADAWREYQAAIRNLTTATAALTDAQEQLRLASLRQNAGKGIELEILDALSVAANAREAIERSIVRYDIAVAAIHHAAGDVSS